MPEVERDPWEFQRWGLSVKTGNVGRKAVLMMLATMADRNTGRCEAKQSTLSKACEAKERTIRAHLRALEESGFIARRPQRRIDGSRRGDEFLLLAPGITEWPDGEHVAKIATSSLPAGNVPPVGTESAGQELPLKNQPLVVSSSALEAVVEPSERQEPSSRSVVLRDDARERAGNDPSTDILNLATDLAIRVKANGFTAPDIHRAMPSAWTQPLLMMLRRDRKQPEDEPWTVEDIRSLIEWATEDDFWRTNIRSAANLRKHRDTLRVRCRQEKIQQMHPRPQNGKAAFREGLLAIARGEA